jgi:DNA polymerase-3 subunit epsilon
MVALATRVDGVVCAHPVEAEVRELRLLAAHRPPYNRRSKNPGHAWWLTLTEEPFPRLSVVRHPRPGALGPFRTRRLAEAAADAVRAAVPVRPCSLRIPASGAAATPCALAELGRCAAPCAGRQTPAEYAPAVVAVQDLVAGRATLPLHVLAGQLDELAAAERFEEAATRRDLLAGLVRALDRGQRMASLAALAELVAARPDGAGGWDLVVIRHGRLASAGVARRGVPPMPVVDLLTASAETVLPGPGPLHGAPPEEIGVLLRWLTQPGTRLVRTSQPWAEPAAAAAGWRSWADRAAAGRMLAVTPE